MVVRIPCQSIRIPTVRGYDAIPDVGVSVQGTGGYYQWPGSLIQNSLLRGRIRICRGVFGVLQEVERAQLVKRARWNDYDALLKLADLSLAADDPVRLRELWNWELQRHGEVRTTPKLVRADLWQLTPARRALRRAVGEFIRRNHGDAERLREFHEWDASMCTGEGVDDNDAMRLCESRRLINMALAEEACVNEDALRAFDALYAMSSCGPASYFPELLSAKRGGLNLNDPKWWIMVESHYAGSITEARYGMSRARLRELSVGASSVGEIKHIRYLRRAMELGG